MIGIFTKPVELLTSTDVDELIAQSWPEGYEVEFKGALPHKKGGTHPWINGGGLDAEFAIEVALGSRGGFPLSLCSPSAGRQATVATPVIFPRTSVGNRSEFDDVLNTLLTDCNDAAGYRLQPSRLTAQWDT